MIVIARIGASVVVRPAKPPPVRRPASYTAPLLPVLDALLLIQLPAGEPGKAAQDGPSTRAPAIHVGDRDGVPGSWYEPVTVPAIVAIRGVKQQLEDTSTLVSPFLFQIKLTKKKKKASQINCLPVNLSPSNR